MGKHCLSEEESISPPLPRTPPKYKSQHNAMRSIAAGLPKESLDRSVLGEQMHRLNE